MTYDIALVPNQTTDRVTYQATIETWRRLWAALPATVNPPTVRNFGPVPEGEDGSVVRIAFPPERARIVARLAGLSS